MREPDIFTHLHYLLAVDRTVDSNLQALMKGVARSVTRLLVASQRAVFPDRPAVVIKLRSRATSLAPLLRHALPEMPSAFLCMPSPN